jgi:MOSC domain-containing protein YiiM
MNARLLRFLAGGGLPPGAARAHVEATHASPAAAGLADRMAMAGDNLIVDLDLSAANLPPGQRLAAGEALLEVTDAPHTGCKSFAQRFGPDAVRYINAAERKAIHLRGRYCRVLRAGTVRVGDLIRKVD